MLKTKKILSIVLAFALIFSTFAFGSSAAMADGKVAGVILTSDKTDIKQGDTVTITLRMEFADYDTTKLATMKLLFLYDSSVFTFKSHEYLNDFASFYNTTKDPVTTAAAYNAIVKYSTLTAAEKATYNAGVMQQFQVTSSLNGGITEKMGYEVTQDGDTGYSVPEYQLTFEVTGDPSKGGTKIFVCDGFSGTKAQTVKTTDGTKVTNHALGAIDISRASAEMKVATATSIVNPMKGQIRFDKNENGGYAGTFDVRAIAKITGDDFTKTFGSIENAIASIESVGFVFAQGSGDYAEMVAVAEAGESGNGYTYAPVDFISTSFDPGNYTFSCIVDNVNDKNDSLVALAYITYVDADGETQTAVYTDVQTVPFADLYDRNFNSVFGA